MSKLFWVLGIAAALCCTGPLLAADAPQAAGAAGGVVVTKVLEYWLGLEASPPTPALRAQLQLPDKLGLVIDSIVPGSPAERDGLKLYDVLLKADGKALENHFDLLKAIQQAKENKLSLELIRAGKPMTIAATPAKRPADASRGEPMLKFEGADVHTLSKWLEKMRTEGGQGPMQFRVLQPGVILPPGKPIKLPEGTSVAISKEGDKPAKIVVKQGEKKWEISEDQLDQLPPALRPLVGQMSPHGPLELRSQQLEMFRGPVTQGGQHETIRSPKQAPAGLGEVLPGDLDLQRRLEQMSRQIDQLRKSLDELRQNRPRPPAAVPPPATEPEPADELPGPKNP